MGVLGNKLVRTAGVEPARGLPLRILSPVCLPVPPRPRRYRCQGDRNFNPRKRRPRPGPSPAAAGQAELKARIGGPWAAISSDLGATGLQPARLGSGSPKGRRDDASRRRDSDQADLHEELAIVIAPYGRATVSAQAMPTPLWEVLALRTPPDFASTLVMSA